MKRTGSNADASTTTITTTSRDDINMNNSCHNTIIALIGLVEHSDSRNGEWLIAERYWSDKGQVSGLPQIRNKGSQHGNGKVVDVNLVQRNIRIRMKI